MKELLEAGVHFGHQTRRWNPKMKEYIFGERNGIYIIDLQKTLKMFKEAAQYLTDLAAQGKNVLFVGTKRQAQEAIGEEARRCNMFYVNHRWLGGTLTNWATIQKSVKRFKDLEAMEEDGRMGEVTKKEAIRLRRELGHYKENLSGIKDLPGLPDAVFVIDSENEAIGVAEARKLSIPVVAVVDTNCDPDKVDHIIPGNDDALRAIRLFASKVADAIPPMKARRKSWSKSPRSMIRMNCCPRTSVRVRFRKLTRRPRRPRRVLRRSRPAAKPRPNRRRATALDGGTTQSFRFAIPTQSSLASSI
jgi:small subunit ribosomal protein S2